MASLHVAAREGRQAFRAQVCESTPARFGRIFALRTCVQIAGVAKRYGVGLPPQLSPADFLASLMAAAGSTL